MARPSKKSLANLRQAPPAEKGNRRALTHGLGAKLPANLPPDVEEIREALAASAPVRASDGTLPVADEAAIEVIARQLAKVRYGNTWLDEHGWFGEDGVLRPVVSVLAKFERQLMEQLDRMGMTAAGRARLGLSLARTVSLADAMSEPDPEKRRAMLADAGLAVDGTAEEVTDE
jgi:hypothetical protein